MKHRYLAYLVLLVTVATLFAACGGGGGGGPVPSVTLTAIYPDYFNTMPETFALANNADFVRVEATVRKVDGTLADDGTTVTFSVPAGSGSTLSSTTATTAGGKASVTVTHVAVTAPAKNAIVPVTASALGVASAINVKFINQPTAVDVSVALAPSLAGVEAVQLDINSTAGVIAGPFAPTTVGINAGTGGNTVSTFDAANNLSHVACLFSPPGINTTASVPIVRISYSVTAGVGVADFTPTAPTITGFIVAGTGGTPLILPSPTTLNFIITFNYNTE